MKPTPPSFCRNEFNTHIIDAGDFLLPHKVPNGEPHTVHGLASATAEREGILMERDAGCPAFIVLERTRNGIDKARL